jgi:signal peptidase II|tara:strand:+ start:541 stop:1038 length:498 start_codon:yes stop_codon:yes gene_type:complete
MSITKNLRSNFFSKGKIISLVIIILVFIFDRVSKIKIVDHQSIGGSVFINDYLNFNLIWNTGVGFGLFSQNANLYYHATSSLIFMVIVFLFYLTIKANFTDKMSFSLIIGGALGNFYDRIYYYAVPDFIDFHINDFHWFTFNIADIFITVGVVVLIVKDLTLNKK